MLSSSFCVWIFGSLNKNLHWIYFNYNLLTKLVDFVLNLKSPKLAYNCRIFIKYFVRLTSSILSAVGRIIGLLVYLSFSMLVIC